MDGGGSVGNADNTALIRVGNLAVSNTGWTAFTYAGSHQCRRRRWTGTPVAIGDSVLITGGNTLITGLNGGGDICRASVVVGRTIVDPTDADGQLVWSEFGGRASGGARFGAVCVSQYLFPRTRLLRRSLNVDTGANTAGGGVIARDNAWATWTPTTDGTADRLANPTPTPD